MRTRLNMGLLVAAWPSNKSLVVVEDQETSQLDINNNNQINSATHQETKNVQDKSKKSKNSRAKNKNNDVKNGAGDDEQKLLLVQNQLVNLNLVENLAPKFKYRENECSEDIELIRNCLREQRAQQSRELQHFYAIEFKRLMEDDWLISRFLMRGSKEAARLRQQAKNINDNEESSINNNNLEMPHKETLRLIEACATFKLKYQMGNELSLADFPLLWTRREGIVVHGLDRNGNACIYMRCQLHKPKLIEQAESRFHFKRLLLYHLNECDVKLINREGHAICCIFDMSSVSLENLDLELIAWMVSSFKHCSPKLLAYVIVYNLPWLFNATFRILTQNLLTRSHQQGLRFVYGRELLHYVSQNNLPQYLQEKVKVDV